MKASEIFESVYKSEYSFDQLEIMTQSALGEIGEG